MNRNCTVLRTVGVLLFGLVFTHSAHAQSLKIPTTLFVAGASADVVSTFQVIAGGGHERNPIWAPLETAPKITAVMIGADVLTVWLAHRLNARHHRLAATALWIGAAGSWACAVHNLSQPPSRTVIANPGHVFVLTRVF